MKPKVLFLLKRREDYTQDPSYSAQGVSTGLLNSATFMHEMLLENGIESHLEVVIDNNCIDRQVTKYRPTHVIIEALWVVPEKFDVLTKLHPNVKWIVRFHSETPFIASEGIAMRWMLGYVQRKNVFVAANAPRFLREMEDVLTAAGYSHHQINERVAYLPNYYPVGKYSLPKKHKHKDHVDVGCFGAIRPLKNHLVQAIAALRFAHKIGKKLRFHVNVGRIEMKGDPILHNLQGLFAGLAEQGHELVMHQWAPHEEFIDVIKGMDIGLQVSFSETFNIVGADMITAGVPIVMSDEIPWAAIGIADPTESDDIADVMETAWNFQTANVLINTFSLKRYVANTESLWVDYFTKGC